MVPTPAFSVKGFLGCIAVIAVISIGGYHLVAHLIG
jgi:hypothetical protein